MPERQRAYCYEREIRGQLLAAECRRALGRVAHVEKLGGPLKAC